MLICSLLEVTPFYDCPPWYDGDYTSSSGDIWFIVMWDGDTVPCWKDGIVKPHNGCAVYDSDSIFVANNTQGYISSAPLWKGMTILQHEIEHLKCQCTWHKR